MISDERTDEPSFLSLNDFLSRNHIDVGSLEQTPLACPFCGMTISPSQRCHDRAAFTLLTTAGDPINSVPHGLVIQCTSDSCKANNSDGNRWYLCLPCKTIFSVKHSMRRHTKSQMHVLAYSNFNVKYLAVTSKQAQQEDANIIDISSGNINDYADDDGCNNLLLSACDQQGTKNVPQPDADDWIHSVAGPRNPDKIPIKELQSAFCDGSKAPEFFSYESEHPNEGAKYLTANAFDQFPQNVTHEEAKFSLKVAYLLSGMTEKEQTLLADILLDVANSKDVARSIFKGTRPPTSKQDFNDIYLKGKSAILTNLPHPVVRYSDDETHAYVDIVDVLANMLAKSTVMERFDEHGFVAASENTINVGGDDETPISVSSSMAGHDLYFELKQDMRELDDKFTLFIWIREWSDDFDPSHTKSNRAQVWLKTFTFCAPASCTSDVNTAFIAIGSKGDDHDDVENIISGQLCQLSTGNGRVMYHGGLNRFIRVKAGIVTTCVDRPKRTKLFKLGDHNGTYSVCWGFAAHIDSTQTENCLPSCPFCRQKRFLCYTGREEEVPDLLHRLSSAPVASSSGSSSQSSEKNGGVAGDNISSSNADSMSLDRNTSFNVGEDSSDSADTDDADAMNESLIVSTFDHQHQVQASSSVAGLCPLGRCSSWCLLDSAYSFPAPKKFPTECDIRNGAPTAPLGREIQPDTPADQRRLRSVYITIPWLEQAVRFAYHNYATRPPGGHPSKRYWRKENFDAFLRTCAIVKSLMTEIANCVQKSLPCPIPTLWTRGNDSLKRCHYAAMHMIFLGHVKSNFLMIQQWLKKYELFTNFGKQANHVLRHVQKLRLRRFSAHPLANSSLGPGSWVSENHLFWARASKYFFMLPAIQSCRRQISTNEVFLQERRVAQRFVASAIACIGCVMSDKRSNDGMSSIIKIYMDTMVEMDDVLLNSQGGQGAAEDGVDGVLDGVDGVGEANADHATPGRRRKKPNKRPTTGKHNFVKSNSLGLLAAAEAHAYFGPAILNWEGGFTGERKIQNVKPLLGIRRSNAKWESIVLTRLYRMETIDWMINRYESEGKDKHNRVADGLYRIFPSREAAIDSIKKCDPLSAIVSKGNLWLLYRPNVTTQPGATRSSVNLLKIGLDDTRGKEICGCWMAPITARPENMDVFGFDSVRMVETVVKQHVLMLPELKTQQNRNQQELYFDNMYYCIGDKWMERDSSGQFVGYKITTSEMFKDWESI